MPLGVDTITPWEGEEVLVRLMALESSNIPLDLNPSNVLSRDSYHQIGTLPERIHSSRFDPVVSLRPFFLTFVSYRLNLVECEQKAIRTISKAIPSTNLALLKLLLSQGSYYYHQDKTATHYHNDYRY